VNIVEREALRDLEILAELARGGQVTQRRLAARLHIALGLTNLYLKRLARKGYIKIATIPRRRVCYLLTPKGVAQKTRLTYEYMDYSRGLYREARTALRQKLLPLVQRGRSDVVLCGTEEAAELAFLTLRELGLEITGVYGEDGQLASFLGFPVRRLGELTPAGTQLVIIARFTPARDIVARLRAQGFSPAQIVTLYPEPGKSRGFLGPGTGPASGPRPAVTS
jgi:DNA-binding MarR family transcriptional regulator